MKNILPKGHTFPTENTGESNLGNLTAIFLPWQKTTSADLHVIVQSRSQRPRYLVSDGDRDKGNPGDRRGWMLLSQYTYTVNPFLWTIRAFTP